MIRFYQIFSEFFTIGTKCAIDCKYYSTEKLLLCLRFVTIDNRKVLQI